MLLETYAAPIGVKTRGRIPENLRIIDMCNVRIRPHDDNPEYCYLYRKNEKLLVIYEDYNTVLARLKYAAKTRCEFAYIRDEEGLKYDKLVEKPATI